MPIRHNRVTIKDVAAEAGVSLMTVSLVMNNKPNVSDETREKVLKAAKKLNYKPNMTARSLNSSRSFTFGVVTSNTSPIIFARVWSGIEREASKSGYSVIFSNTNDQPDKERDAIDILIQKRVDGILLIAPICTKKEDLAQLDSFGIPYVMLLRRDPDNPTDACLNNNVKGGSELVDYLAMTGSKKFLFMAVDRNVLSVNERLIGYEQALQKHGMRLEDSEIIRGSAQMSSGYENMKKILDENRLGADTIVCGSDLIAIGVMKALQERGIDIPGQVRIAGYDNLDISSYLSIPLTTVNQPHEEIGEFGVKILLERIEQPQRPINQIILDCQLVIRQST